MAGSTTDSLTCDANKIYRNQPQKLPVLVWILARLVLLHLVEKTHGHHSLPSFNRDFVLVPQWFAGMIKCGKIGRYGKRGMVTYREEGEKKSLYPLVWRMDIWSHIHQATAQQSFWNLGSYKSFGEDFQRSLFGPGVGKHPLGNSVTLALKWSGMRDRRSLTCQQKWGHRSCNSEPLLVVTQRATLLVRMYA